MSGYTINDFQMWLLVLFRFTGMMATAPVFGTQSAPYQFKAGLALATSFLLFPFVPRDGVVLPPTLAAYLPAVGLELAVGIIIGFAASMFFAGVQFAGHLMDQELGFGMANVIDPVTNEQASILNQFKFMLATLVFLALEGHHFLLRALMESFDVVPLMGLRWSDRVALAVADDLMRNLLTVGVKLAAPTVVAGLLVTVAMALLARTVPEMNVFILGFSIRIIVGLVVILLGIPLFAVMTARLSGSMLDDLNVLIQLMGGR